MNNPRISWEVFEQIDDVTSEYVQYKTYTEEGSFIPGDYISKTLRVWNNYSGKEDIKDALNCSLIVAFKNFEDSFLLNLTTISIDKVIIPVEIDVDKGVVALGELSGKANTGSTSNISNFKEIKIDIGPVPANMKSELKSMYFYLEYVTE